MHPDSEKRPEVEDLRAALAGGEEQLGAFLEELHPADLVDLAGELEPDELDRVLAHLDNEECAELFKFADDDLAREIFGHFSVERAVEIVELLPADEVVDLLALAEDERADRILRSVDFERAQGLRKLARYDEETAGGLMTVEYVSVDQDANVGDAIKLIRTEEGPAADEEGGVFVLDEAGRPVGYVSDRDLLTTPIHTPISEVMNTDLVTVGVQADQEEVGRLFMKYSFPALPVIDARGALIGVISSEDAQDVVQEEAEEDIGLLVGTSPEGLQTHRPVLERVRHRIPVMGVTVGGGLLIAWLLGEAFPESKQGGNTDILRYLPIVLGLSGNVGMQSSTILVRGFATGEVTQDRLSSVVRTEVLVGFLIGVACAIITMGVAPFSEASTANPMQFAAAISAAICVAVTWSTLLGCVVPIGFERIGMDPAIAAGPFFMTLSDLSGSCIFLGVSSLLLHAVMP